MSTHLSTSKRNRKAVVMGEQVPHHVHLFWRTELITEPGCVTEALNGGSTDFRARCQGALVAGKQSIRRGCRSVRVGSSKLSLVHIISNWGAESRIGGSQRECPQQPAPSDPLPLTRFRLLKLHSPLYTTHFQVSCP